MKFEKVEVNKEGNVILTVKSGFAFLITTNDRGTAMFVMDNKHSIAEKTMHLCGQRRKYAIVGIYGDNETVTVGSTTYERVSA